MLLLYDFPRSGNCYKVRLLFAHLGIAYRRINRDITKGESRTPEHLALNPAGKVPVVETEAGARFTESGAILWHFARGSRLFPASPEEETQTLQWLPFEQSALFLPIGRARYWTSVVRQADAHRDEVAMWQGLGHQGLTRLDAHFADGNPFAVGRRFTIADIALYAYAHVAPEGGYDLAPYPAMRSWFDRVRSEPGHVSIDAT